MRTPTLTLCLLPLATSGCLGPFLARSLVHPKPQTVVADPSAYGLAFEDVTLHSADGTELRGWYMPGGGDRLVVMTHPMTFTKYGFDPDQQGMFKVTRLQVEFLRTAQALVGAGWSVLTFDFRNHGDSAPADGGWSSVGLTEWQDVAGAMDWIAARPDLADDRVAFVSHCMGANSTIVAMSEAPERFANTRCLVAVQPVLSDRFAQLLMADRYPAFQGRYPAMDRAVERRTGHRLEDMSPVPYLADLKVPVMVAQVKADPWTDPADIQAIYDALPGQGHRLLWMEGDERFDGYNYFGEHPAELLDFLETCP